MESWQKNIKFSKRLIQWERNDAIPGKPKLTWYQPVHKSIHVFWLSISIIKYDLKIIESKKKMTSMAALRPVYDTVTFIETITFI